MNDGSFTSLLIAAALFSGNADAQDLWYGAVVPYAYSGASTPESAAYFAAAEYLRAQGKHTVLTSEAAKNYEVARGVAISNQRQLASFQAETKEALATQKARAKEESRIKNAKRQELRDSRPASNVPPRLDESQFDRSTGRIVWPSGLMREAFASHRADLELLLETGAKNGGMSDVADEITQKTKSLHQELRKNIKNMLTQEYLEARKFISSLALEGQYPV